MNFDRMVQYVVVFLATVTINCDVSPQILTDLFIGTQINALISCYIPYLN
jgi:hypothetical protein